MVEGVGWMGSKSTISRFERLFIEIFSLTSSIMNFSLRGIVCRSREFQAASTDGFPLPLHKLILHLLARANQSDAADLLNAFSGLLSIVGQS